jgi:glutaminase
MDFKAILHDIYNKVNEDTCDGSVTSSIPELSKVDPNKFGIHLLKQIVQTLV